MKCKSFILLFSFVFTACVIQQPVEDKCERCEMCRACVTEMDNWTSRNDNGFYLVDKKFYCVWTGNRNSTEILKTESHEACHALIEIDYDHFCNDNMSSVRYREWNP